MDPQTFNAFLKLFAIQQTQIVSLLRLVARGQPTLPVTLGVAFECLRDTHRGTGADIERSVREMYRILMLNQQMDEEGLRHLWELASESDQEGGEENDTSQ